MFIEKEILDVLIPKLKIRSINSLDRLLTLLEVFSRILSATIEEEEVAVKSFLLLDLLRVTTKMIQDNKIYLETVERLLAKHEERWQKILEEYQKQGEASEARIQEISDKTEKHGV